MIDFLSGAATVTYVAAALFFVRFWRRTSDRLFLAFAVAFMLLAVNQGLTTAFDAATEAHTRSYMLRVLGFLIILGAIVDKNLSARKTRR
jgi:hypothetical protein